jgi:DNA-directed RNA polymerase specialized sigma24 family protein
MPMPPSTHSVTRLLDSARAGDPDAYWPLFERFYPRLVAEARQRLRGAGLVVADPADAVTRAYESFCAGVAGDGFAKVRDRDELLALLVVIVVRKACNLVKHEQAQRRGGGVAVHGGDALEVAPARGPAPVFLPGRCRELLGGFADPDLADLDPAALDAECLRLLGVLAAEGDRLQELVLWKLLGYTNDEIAADKLKCTLRAVERKLKRVRELWVREVGDA